MIRFGNVGQLQIVHAKSAFCVPDFAAIQVFIIIEWLYNNIADKFNILFLPNIWTQTQNIVILGQEFGTKTVLAVVGAIFGVCISIFGGIQVSIIVKWMCNDFLITWNIKPCPNFWNHTKIYQFLAKFKHAHIQIDGQWCFGRSLGTKIWGQIGIYAYNIMVQHNCSAYKQKKIKLLCLPM